MFGLFKSKSAMVPARKVDPLVGLLAQARSRGDKKQELLLSIALIGDSIITMHTKVEQIDDYFCHEGLDELVRDAGNYFPPDIALEMNRFKDEIEEIWEPVDNAASTSMRILKLLNGRGLI